MNLEDRLRKILAGMTAAEKLTDELYDDGINRIKQLFADEGYIQIPTVAEHIDDDKSTHLEVRGVSVMTGQEWYDRFEKELWQPPKQEYGFKNEEERDRFFRAGGTNFMYEQALKAAKKASRLNE